MGTWRITATIASEEARPAGGNPAPATNSYADFVLRIPRMACLLVEIIGAGAVLIYALRWLCELLFCAR